MDSGKLCGNRGNYVETNLVKVLRRAVLLLAVSVLLFYLRGEEFR